MTSREFFINQFEEYVNKTKNYDELIIFLIENYDLIKKDTRFLNPPLELKQKPRDWEDFDLYINLTHSQIVPPHHYCQLEYSLEQFDKICIKYEYYFKYSISLILNKEESFNLVNRYVMSIFIIDFYYLYKTIESQRFKKIPLIGGLLSWYYINDKNDNLYDNLHFECKRNLENYIESKLDSLDKKSKLKKYNDFFGDTPENKRGMWINM